MTTKAAQPVLEMETSPKPEQALTPVGIDMVSMLERLASNPAVDVDKLRQLIDMQERVLSREAEAAFYAAFSAMQPEIPEIDERGGIKNNSGIIQSTYARNEDIQKALKPILAKHGFTLTFKTEWPDAKTVRVVGILAHCQGHQRTSEFMAQADTSGNKNAIQALGSSVSYGHRYTTKDLLNITSRVLGDSDDDGATSEQFNAPEGPDGFDAFVEELTTAAGRGSEALYKHWNKGDAKLRQHVTRHHKNWWANLRQQAEQVQA